MFQAEELYEAHGLTGGVLIYVYAGNFSQL